MTGGRTYLRALAFAASLLAFPSVAGATSTFPTVIQTTLTANKAPECSVCHAGGATGVGTVTTKLGAAMRARGLVANDEASLKRALTAMETDKVDSDGDGVIDVDELRVGTDPNTAEGGGASKVVYGCTAAGDAPFAGAALLTLLAGALVRRRRVRQRSPSHLHAR